ncbi:MAG TPA: FAD-dependent oxidoreductase [Candidatus Saccharimonadales bacterium]|nr:FAD-dependent oxidoreductase [Candidatus Saccharimonadales bacterium]
MYDLVVIGAGPAGLTASIYACCFKLNHVLLDPVPGGQMIYAPDVLNYPGFPEISGTDLTDKMVDQLKKRGGNPVADSVVKIEKTNEDFKVFTKNGNSYETRTIILATGVERRKLNVPGENEYTGKGIQYCATCDRFDYEGKTVAVVGGANAAAQAAIQLSHAATKVFIIYRGESLRCDPIWLTQIEQTKNIEILPNVAVAEILGDGQKLNGVKLTPVNANIQTPIQSGQTPAALHTLSIEKLFIEIGGVPGTSLLVPLGIKLDSGGYIEVGEHLGTSIPGIFAAGDIVSHKYAIEQISAAVGAGAHAATSAFSYIKQQKAPHLWGGSQIPQQSI